MQPYKEANENGKNIRKIKETVTIRVKWAEHGRLSQLNQLIGLFFFVATGSIRKFTMDLNLQVLDQSISLSEKDGTLSFPMI